MRFLLASIGSAGDLNPVLGLAATLRGRGHAVTVAANPVFAAAVTATGADFVALGTAEAHHVATATPDAWHPRRGIGVLARHLVVPAIAPLVELIGAAAPGTIVAATTLCLGARVAEERFGRPTAMLHLQPAVFRSRIAPPVSQGFAAITRVPVPVRRAAYYAIDRFVVDPLFAPTLSRLRGRATRRVLDDFVHSPRCTLGLFPAWFAPPQPDWPRSQLVDFVRYDGAAAALDGALAAWLAAGPPPIVFTAGTAMHHAAALFAAAIAACARLGRRGVILTGQADQVPALPAGMRHVAYAPLGALAARSAALVHHGGIGTAARALEAGIPQVVVPMAHDQFDNAARLARLGVARVLDRDRVARELDGALAAVLGDPAIAAGVTAAAARWRGDGGARTCDVLERLAA